MTARQLGGVVVTGALLAAGSGPTRAQAPRTVQDGVYTDAQAARGQALYVKQCASCHGDTLKGAQAPPLVGDAFVAAWQTMPLGDLVSKVRNTMPADAPGQLTPPQSADIVAHLLKTGGFPAGRADLASADAALSQNRLAAAARRRAGGRLGEGLSPARQHGAADAGGLLPDNGCVTWFGWSCFNKRCPKCERI